MSTNVGQTLDAARTAISGFSENMDALRHNFLLRGFFRSRGYFDLAEMTPADYRVELARNGIDRSSDLPRTVTIAAGATTYLDVTIDTGIR